LLDVTTGSQLCNQKLIPEDLQRFKKIHCTLLCPQAHNECKNIDNLLEYLHFSDFPSTNSDKWGSRGICNGQNLTLTRMMTRIQATKSFPQKIHNSQSSTRSLCYSWLSWSYPQSRASFHHS